MKDRKTFPKINSIHFGGICITVAFVIGALIPAIIYWISGYFCWPLCVIGGIVLLGFIIVFMIEMRQDNGKTPYYVKQLSNQVPFDSDRQYPVIKCSICNGEQVAGFKDKENGAFTEVMLITSESDLELFKKAYGIDDIKKIY